MCPGEKDGVEAGMSLYRANDSPVCAPVLLLKTMSDSQREKPRKQLTFRGEMALSAHTPYTALTIPDSYKPAIPNVDSPN